MAAKIRVLSDHTINQIAAGEVIENPASVVKELVENSIDAGATDICIEIQGGGRQLIRISDNGCGMNSDDALLCLECHATSKLKDVDDIHTISTMGFRGEAIPSIASISKFNILTCPPAKDDYTQQFGTMVIVDGGKLLSCTPAARSQGTTIEVKSLFFNVPVRKKFLRSPAVDANEIHKTVSLIALGYPTIKFQLISDGKSLLSTQAADKNDSKDQLQGRIEDVLGHDFVQNTTYINESSNGITIEGMVGLPSYTRHNRTGQYLYINRRAVVSPLIAYAVKDGFATSIDSGRFPVFVLNLSLDGSWVDVNVHPQKREVRLRQEQMIRELVVRAVRNSLSHQHASTESTYQPAPVSPVFAAAFLTKDPRPSFASSDAWEFKPKAALEYATAPTEHFAVAPPTSWGTPSLQPKASVVAPQIDRFTSPSLSLPEPSPSTPKIAATIPGYLIIDGHAQHPFIEKGCRFPGKGGVILIDQRNAHARIIFEKLSSQDHGSTVAQQSLLIPHTIERSPHESERLRLALPLLHKMGIRIEEFGQNTFIIDALPQVFGNSNIDLLIQEVVNDSGSTSGNDAGDSAILKEHAKRISLAASRAAVSSTRKLSPEEGHTLLTQLTKCQQPYQCPAGKPVLVQISTDDLARLFQK
jgi:DNA mismatch repair protein MutL